MDELCRGTPVALIRLGVRARRHHPVGDRASDIPEGLWRPPGATIIP
jgi:hypothetical protein